MATKQPQDPHAHTGEPLLDRRSALSALGMFGSTFLLGCTHQLAATVDAPRTDAASADAATSGDGSTTGACTVTREGEIGPYFADDSATGFARSNILSNLDGTETQTGVPFTLNIYVYDSEKSCAAVAGAQIDIWHCNASGVYSDIEGEGTSTEQWLRGYQLTDANGKVTFTTIVPGWYQGRTTHIHLRIRSSYSEASSTTDGTNTTQVFFPQALVDTLATSVAPYNAEGTNPTTNASDRVYAQETAGTMLMSPTGDTASGYTASVSIYLPITTES